MKIIQMTWFRAYAPSSAEGILMSTKAMCFAETGNITKMRGKEKERQYYENHVLQYKAI